MIGGDNTWEAGETTDLLQTHFKRIFQPETIIRDFKL